MLEGLQLMGPRAGSQGFKRTQRCTCSAWPGVHGQQWGAQVRPYVASALLHVPLALREVKSPIFERDLVNSQHFLVIDTW